MMRGREGVDLEQKMERGVTSGASYTATFGLPHDEPEHDAETSGITQRWPVMLTEGTGLNATYA
jgi:hypothetical protein